MSNRPSAGRLHRHRGHLSFIFRLHPHGARRINRSRFFIHRLSIAAPAFQTTIVLDAKSDAASEDVSPDCCRTDLGGDLREGVIAEEKHVPGYAMTEAAQNMAATQATARELREVHARPFAADDIRARAAAMRPG